MNYPVGCETPSERIEYLYSLQEKLRLVHNLVGDWYREGISLETWEKLPEKVKVAFPYKQTLSLSKWNKFKQIFARAEMKIVEQIGAQRQNLKDSVRWTANLEELF